MVQRKIWESLKLLPKKKQESLQMIEEKKRRPEVQEMKRNVWKKWRGRKEKDDKKERELSKKEQKGEIRRRPSKMLKMKKRKRKTFRKN